MDDSELRQERRRWASEHIRDLAGGMNTPRYGSTAWHRLSDESPLKLASVVRAAELWASDTDGFEALASTVEVGEPMPVDDGTLKAIVSEHFRAVDALRARAAAGDKAAEERVKVIDEKAWLSETSVWDRLRGTS